MTADSERCASYYQNIDTAYQPLEDPVRCKLPRGHDELHAFWSRRAGTTRWPDRAQMIHPFQARAAGHGPNCVPDPKHPSYWICDLATHPSSLTRAAQAIANHQHEAWQLQESAKGGMYCAACGQDVITADENDDPLQDAGDR